MLQMFTFAEEEKGTANRTANAVVCVESAVGSEIESRLSRIRSRPTSKVSGVFEQIHHSRIANEIGWRRT